METTAIRTESLADEGKGVLNKNKFVENTQRIIGMTKKIVTRISGSDKQISNMYSDIPDLLEMAGNLLVSMGNEIHIKMLHGFLRGVLIQREESSDNIPVWKKIKSKNDSVLTENLSIILSENPFVPRIQYVYGANPTKKCYVNQNEIDIMWKLITALIHNSIKYVIHNNIEEFIPYISKELIDEFKIQL